MLRFLRIVWLCAMVWVVAACGGGGSSSGGSSDMSAASTSAAPAAVIQVHAKAMSTGSTLLQVRVGDQIELDGSASLSQDGAPLKSHHWTLTSLPDNSTAAILEPDSAKTSFTPDTTGSYVLTLTVTDSQNQTASHAVTIVSSAGYAALNVTQTVSFLDNQRSPAARNLPIGSIVTLDASASTSPTGEQVQVSWQLIERPSGSKAVLNGMSTSLVNFTADQTGRYQIKASGTNPAGQSWDSTQVFNVLTDVPAISIAANVSSLNNNVPLSASVGNLVLLDSALSVAPAGHAVGRTWTLVAKPGASTRAELSSTSGISTSFIPDIAGDYQIRLQMLDTVTGTSSVQTLLVRVRQGISVVITGLASPVVQLTAPGLVTSTGVPVTLRGSSSYTPGGGVLTYAWELTSKPATSAATLTTPNQANLTFTPDKDGSYVLKLTVTDETGVSAARSVSVQVGSYPPVITLEREQATTVVGSPVTVRASATAPGSGEQTLTYQWSIDARPQGSVATIADATGQTLKFTPDVAGNYHATVTVSSGSISSIAAVAITALTPTPGATRLDYAPLQVRYSKSQGKVVIVSTNPNMLHLVDPVSSADVGISLPTAVKELSISPDGQLAAVLHEGTVSLVDLVAGSLIHTSATNGSQTAALVTNEARIYLLGQSYGGTSGGFVLLDGRTGAVLPLDNSYPYSIYGTARAVLADSIGKIFTMSLGLSPTDFLVFGVDATSGQITSYGDSPYHGDYAMSEPLWLSGDQGLLFTGAGTYFRTGDLTYAGTLGAQVFSVSHSATAQEAVALSSTKTYYFDPTSYPSAYKRFTGALLMPVGEVPLPTVIGTQSYGLHVFHTANDKLAFVVQTGDAKADAAGLSYFVLLR